MTISIWKITKTIPSHEYPLPPAAQHEHNAKDESYTFIDKEYSPVIQHDIKMKKYGSIWHW